MTEPIYYHMSPIEAKIYHFVKEAGKATKADACSTLAEREIFGSCHDFEDASLRKLYQAAQPKYQRNFDGLRKVGILKCVNRRKSIYEVTV